MTVGELWSGLGRSCVRKANMEWDVRGKSLAVDLSCWLVEAGESATLKAQHVNPHLYLVWSRAVWLRKVGCKAVYVVEGATAHRLKRRGGCTLTRPRSEKTEERSSLAARGRECTRLLEALGCVCIQVPAGVEGEAVAAAIAQDGVVTSDSDAFAYGARKVYRNLTPTAARQNEVLIIEPSEHEVFGVFEPQPSLIAWALLVGSDLNEGGHRVGKKTATNFLKRVNLRRCLGNPLDALETLRYYRDGGTLPGEDPAILKHCLESECPDEGVVSAFLLQDYQQPFPQQEHPPDLDKLFVANAQACVIGTSRRASFPSMLRVLAARPARLDEFDFHDAPPLIQSSDPGPFSLGLANLPD